MILIFLSSCTNGDGDNEQANILIIIADDLGYSDLSCYGGEINTPNLDRLADKGIRFTEFYNSARCCPSRASVLTGLYPHRAVHFPLQAPAKDINKYKGTYTVGWDTIRQRRYERMKELGVIGVGS